MSKKLGANNKHIVVAVTDSVSTTFLRGQLSFMKSKGLIVTLITSPGDLASDVVADEGVDFQPCSMAREIAPKQDLLSLWRLCRVLRKLKPAVVNAGTPKAGLLLTVAAWFCRVPCRIYTLHGLRLETASGAKHLVLRCAEWITCRLSHRIICVSPSLRERVLALGLASPEKAIVLRKGSCNGLDAEYFKPTYSLTQHAHLIRQKHCIAIDAMVLGFIGRIVRDKGIAELLGAWRRLRDHWPNMHLLLIGPTESGDAVPPEVEQEIREDPRIHLIGQVNDTRPYYAAMDVLVLPTYREGLPYVLLEASSMELPIVATRVTGCVDAVADGQTGTLVPARDADALANAIEKYLASPALRQEHGKAGRQRILQDFRQEVIWEAQYEEYLRLLQEKKVLS
jgi:glycosyltransferase involved in cell wall biosynthesis